MVSNERSSYTLITDFMLMFLEMGNSLKCQFTYVVRFDVKHMLLFNMHVILLIKLKYVFHPFVR